MGATAGASRTANVVLRRIREQERLESRSEFARALSAMAERMGEGQMTCDARMIARWERGEVSRPHPVHRRVLAALLGRPFDVLGFPGARTGTGAPADTGDSAGSGLARPRVPRTGVAPRNGQLLDRSQRLLAGLASAESELATMADERAGLYLGLAELIPEQAELYQRRAQEALELSASARSQASRALPDDYS